MDNSTSWKNLPGWLAPAAIALGLGCIVVGFGLLTWTPGSAALAQTETMLLALPSATLAYPTATEAPLPTLALMVTSAPTGSPFPTASPSPMAKRVISLAETGATFTLTIVHSNDTWGYTRPCG